MGKEPKIRASIPCRKPHLGKHGSFGAFLLCNLPPLLIETYVREHLIE